MKVSGSMIVRLSVNSASGTKGLGQDLLLSSLDWERHLQQGREQILDMLALQTPLPGNLDFVRLSLALLHSMEVSLVVLLLGLVSNLFAL